jgi:hypothetical protein
LAEIVKDQDFANRGAISQDDWAADDVPQKALNNRRSPAICVTMFFLRNVIWPQTRMDTRFLNQSSKRRGTGSIPVGQANQINNLRNISSKNSKFSTAEFDVDASILTGAPRKCVPGEVLP